MGCRQPFPASAESGSWRRPATAAFKCIAGPRQHGSAVTARVAYLDNGPSPDGISGLADRFVGAGFTVDRYWAYRQEFPTTLGGYCGVFLSGSPHGAYDDMPFIHREHDFIAGAAEAGVPMLGVCFGSQILASALCGRDQVYRRSACDVGHAWHLTQPPASDDALMVGVDSRFRMFVWHNDEVRADHRDMTILASTAECPNQVWRFRDRPVWGIQGHPEVTRANAAAWMEKSRTTLEQDGADVDRLIAEADDSKGGLAMLANFLAVCRAHVE